MKLVSLRVVLVLATVYGLAVRSHGQVLINEILAHNSNSLVDQDSEHSDWIELFNEGSTPVNLQGWSLTDRTDQLGKWHFPDLTLPAGGYAVVFASGKDRAVAGAELHTNFSLDGDGEYLALVEPDGKTIEASLAPAYPRQEADISYGLFEGSFNYFTTPTPGAPNTAGLLGLVEDTKFSQDRGFYATPIELSITCATPGATIYYATNGIPPSATNGVVYTAPLQINATTVVRAAAFKPGYLPSKVDTQTYLFLDDVIRQSANGKAPPGWPTSWGGNIVDYGMDPDVVNNTRYSGTIKNDLKTIPSFSIVMDLRDLFDSSRGIYANPDRDTITWERPSSLELIYPDGTKGFQVNAGIRIRGGYSRNKDNPKHAFRFFFREEYGDSKLKYPLFGNQGADTFDKVDLRTFQNYSWSFAGDPTGVFIRDQFSRDAQLALGHQGERGRYYHLYINGQYWGLYNTAERPEASYGATYFGGNKEDYDVIKVAPDTSYTIYATDGDLKAWTRLWNAAKAGFSTDEAYQKVQGNNPDGTANPDYEVLLDVDGLIDYMLVILYGGNLDAPISNFLGNASPNNFFAVRNRTARQGFQFFAHDAEHTLLNVDESRIGTYPAGSTLDKSNPQWIWQQCWSNLEFRIRVADRAQKAFFDGGVLSPQGATNLFLKRKAEIDRAVVGESARWGDSKRPSSPLTRDVDWVAEVNRIVNSYMPQRTAKVLAQLRSKNLYPKVVAPSYNQHGGNVPPGFAVSITAPAGTIYYTLDGSDPRLNGGAIAAGALAYSGPILLNESLTLKSRVWDGTAWSALNEAAFTAIQTFKDLLISEIMFNPPDSAGQSGDEFEFVELKNVGPVELDLSGIHFSGGIDFTFPNGRKLGAGRFVVLVSNPTAFATKYPGVQVDGTYSGKLSNGGENLALVHATGTPIFSVTYEDANPWPISTDGQGFSLVPVNPNLNPDPNNAANWRASSRPGGSPGIDDAPINIQPVWINEVLTHTDPPDVDQVELFNPGPADADVSYWFLTDSRATPRKFQIPAGTSIAAGHYAVFTEDDFNPASGSATSFRFDSHGEEAYLYSADASGELTGFSDGFSFGAAANGVTFGRFINSAGEIQYPAQSARTMGAANAGPLVGPVVINEINYSPGPVDQAFVEIKNITAEPVKLYDPAHATNGWKLDGLGFDFPPNSELAANGLAVLVPGEPALFRARYAVPASVPVFGPYPGVLQKSGEMLELKRPDAPDLATNGQMFVPYVVVDAVRYNDRAPWPTNAAGLGSSLERINPTAYGDDPANWRASFASPTPGYENDANRVPRVNAGADQILQGSIFPITANLAGQATDDGQPNPPAALTFTWQQAGGPGPVTFSNPHQLSSTASFPGVGTYTLRLTANDGALESSDEMNVTIERTPSQVSFVPMGSVWKYLDDGTDQGTQWRTLDFSDDGWRSGPAELGYGDSSEGRPEKTVITSGSGDGNKYITYYFRRAFDVSNASAVKQLTVQLVRDDGGIVYVNGIEVFRNNMPTGTIDSSTFASTVISGGDEAAVYESPVDPSVLQEGRNVIAVEMHQANLTSSDISFDLALNGLALPDNQPPAVNAGPDLQLPQGAQVALNGTAVDDGLPMPPGQLTVSWSQISGPGTVTFANPIIAKTTAAFSAAGTYVLRLTASDGALTTQDDATVTITIDPMIDWKIQYFTAAELRDPLISGNGADPDHDGHTNLQEFRAGTDPKDPQSVLKFQSVDWNHVPGIPLKLQFQAMPNKSYVVQCQDYAGAPWITLDTVSPQPIAHLAEVNDYGASKYGLRFYRIIGQ